MKAEGASASVGKYKKCPHFKCWKWITQQSVGTVYGSTCGAKNLTNWKGDISRTVRKHKVIIPFHSIPNILYLSTCLPVGTWLSAVRKRLRPPKKPKAELLKTYLKDNRAHIHLLAIYTKVWIYFCCLNRIMVLTSRCSLREAGTWWELQNTSCTAVYFPLATTSEKGTTFTVL